MTYDNIITAKDARKKSLRDEFLFKTKNIPFLINLKIEIASLEGRNSVYLYSSNLNYDEKTWEDILPTIENELLALGYKTYRHYEYSYGVSLLIEW